MTKEKIYEVTKTIYGMARTRSYTLKGTLEELIEATRYTLKLDKVITAKSILLQKQLKALFPTMKKLWKKNKVAQ